MLNRSRWILLGIFYSFIFLFIASISLVLSAQQLLLQSDLNLVKRVELVYGIRAAKRVRSWRTMVMEHQDNILKETEKLKLVNSFFNRMYFIDDIKLWQRKDYWSTPTEFLGAAGGDCEDFSIAKYYTLLELGIPDEKIRLVYVKALNYNIFHMVVAYYETPSAIPVILDNLMTDIRLATARKDLVPIYSFNGSHLWLMKARAQGEMVGEATRLGLWNDVRNRITSERLAQPIIKLDD
ncbi:transglutaminase-like cysteine peptidase [Aeromonas cavernicola]|uniref:transglutaminase-like cysteine peptidase n=1 Tax=Aeromonas cavernicola TaxID=1006623 RepID=UPI003B82D005